MSARNVKLAPGQAFPACTERYVYKSLQGRDVVHLFPPTQYPSALCGIRGVTWDRTESVEFARVLCGECLRVAAAEVAP